MQVTIKIPNMTCDHCKMTIENALKNLAGIDKVEVDLSGKQAQVSGTIEIDQVVNTIRSAGYNAAEILSIKP